MSHRSARIHKLKKLVVPLPCFFILGTCLYLSYAAILLAPNGVSTIDHVLDSGKVQTKR